MASTDDLIEFTLAAIGCPHDRKAVEIAHAAEIAPEVTGDPSVARVAHDFCEFAVADDLPHLAAELELIARVVDRPGVIGVHEHPVFDITHQRVDWCGARLNIQVCHPVDWGAIP